MLGTVRRLLVIANANAGSASADALGAAVAALRDACDVRVAQTREAGELADVLADRGDRTVVVAGGDGSVHAVVGTLYERGELTPREPIGVLPLGTGNDLARTLGIPLEPGAAAGLLPGAAARLLDLLVDDAGGVVVNAVHAGAGAEAAQTAAGMKERLGPAAYPVGAVVAGTSTSGWRLRVEVDGRVLADGGEPILMVGIGNGTSIGGGALLTPDARPDDGVADVVVSASTGLLARLGFALDLRDGDHPDRDDVTVARGRMVHVSGEEFCVNADGDVAGPLTARTWRVLPHAWSVLAPSEEPS